MASPHATLPTCIDEKTSTPSSASSSFGGPDLEGLNVAQPSASFRIKTWFNELPVFKKIVTGALAVWFGLFLGNMLIRTVLVPSKFISCGHPRRHNEPTITPATWTEPTLIYTESLPVDLQQFTANGTLPLKLHRHRDLSIEFVKDIQAKVIVSRSEADEASLVLESVWPGASLPDWGLELVSGQGYDTLLVNASTERSHHILHVILPASSCRLPSLHLSSPSELAVEIHPSAANIMFDSFSLQTDAQVILPPIQGNYVEINSETGDIGGSFNVTKSLVLHTVTGNITADVHVVPHLHRGKRNRSHSHHGSVEEHKDEHHEGEDKEKHHSKHEKKHHIDHEKKDHVGYAKRDHHHRGKKDHQSHVKDRRHSAKKDHRAERRPWWLFGFGDKKKNTTRRCEHDLPQIPAFIGAYTSTGSIDLHLHQPPFISSHVKALSHSNNVKVHAAESFKGFFEAGSHVGNVSAKTSGDKEIKLLKEVVSGTGGFIEGLVTFAHEHSETEAVEGEEWMKSSQHSHGTHDHYDNGDRRGPRPGPDGPQPPHGPHGPGGPSPPPGKGRVPRPPPPPGKGRGPHGPHRSPARRGCSRIEAKTDVGEVTLTL